MIGHIYITSDQLKEFVYLNFTLLKDQMHDLQSGLFFAYI